MQRFSDIFYSQLYRILCKLIKYKTYLKRYHKKKNRNIFNYYFRKCFQLYWCVGEI
jgi:hypothetical protein